MIYTQTQKLSQDETQVYLALKDYKSYLKNPDTMVIRGSALLHKSTDNDGKEHYFIYADVGGSNSYAATVYSTIYCRNGEFIGSLDDEDEIEKNEELKMGSLLFSVFELIGLSEHETFVDCSKIARKLKCKYISTND